MEDILRVVIEEIDDIHAELASCLLRNLTKEAQVISSLFFTLNTIRTIMIKFQVDFSGISPSILQACGEANLLVQRSVFFAGMCKDRLIPVFAQLLRGNPLDNYSNVVMLLCRNTSNVVAYASGTNMVSKITHILQLQIEY
jgi:hypothetical protein